MGRIYNATWGRLFSALYDSGLKASEDAGLREMRHELLAQAQGRVLELGAGTGLNLEHYPEAIESLTLVEPDPHMTKRLREKLAQSNRAAEVVEAPAEELPFPDDSFDTAAVTLVLCTVPDQSAALVEIRRILKPDGQLLFLEHVRSRNPNLAKWQDRWERPWHFLGDGCYCNRDTVSAISAAGFSLGDIEHGRLPKAVAIVRPVSIGSAHIGA
ncbi:MAG TPA: class I SAM-dependent methyltransferase [Solirubrobacterales bacterium]|nr:class I SAM-dependent methyltransferase [Solirubrobacterales bacterium]